MLERAVVWEAVDEDRRRAPRTACQRARAVGLDPVEMDMRRELLPELLGVEPDLVGVAFQVGPLERLLAAKEEVVHGPEAPLRGRRLARLRRGERVRMDLDEWEVSEGEAERNALGLEGLDASVGGAGVRALVVAEDEEYRPA